MKIVKGTAVYTGGGCYSIIGQLDNGLWFNGCNEWCSVLSKDTRTLNEYEELACFYNEWCEKYDVTSKFDYKELVEAFKNFCIRLDNDEPGITDGYEDFSNYIIGEVSKFIDFSEMKR